MTSDFQNPLAARADEFTAIDFGAFAPAPPVVQLGDRLEAALMQTVADLPRELADEIAAELKIYAGNRPRFIDLFYVPIWSFLHWVLVASPRGDAEVMALATEAHALSLFMHLWDDHLADGQLKPALSRVHLRALAWRRYQAATAELAKRVAGGAEIVERLVGNYLRACHKPPQVKDLASFNDRFVQQIGIWLVTPTLLGHIAGGAGTANALASIIADFGVAWRLIDDVEDIAIDVRTGQENGVWFALDSLGRARWRACGQASQGAKHPEPRSWSHLVFAVRQTGALNNVLDEVKRRLSAAERTAQQAGWGGLAEELALSGQLRGLARDL
jgi:hypothetical protein